MRKQQLNQISALNSLLLLYYCYPLAIADIWRHKYNHLVPSAKNSDLLVIAPEKTRDKTKKTKKAMVFYSFLKDVLTMSTMPFSVGAA